VVLGSYVCMTPVRRICVSGKAIVHVSSQARVHASSQASVHIRGNFGLLSGASFALKYLCVCVCVHTHIHTHTHTYISIHMYIHTHTLEVKHVCTFVRCHHRRIFVNVSYPERSLFHHFPNASPTFR
jgi:hypothetical protein